MRRLTKRMRAARAEPLEPYVGADEPWRCACLTCGEVGLPPSVRSEERPAGPLPAVWPSQGQQSAMRIPSHEAVSAMGRSRIRPDRALPRLCRCLVLPLPGLFDSPASAHRWLNSTVTDQDAVTAAAWQPNPKQSDPSPSAQAVDGTRDQNGGQRGARHKQVRPGPKTGPDLLFKWTT